MNDVSFFPVGRSMRLDVMGGIHDPIKEVFLSLYARHDRFLHVWIAKPSSRYLYVLHNLRSIVR